MRPTRRKIKFDEDSVNTLFQELYNDTYNIKAKITRLFTKWEQKVKEGGEIAAIGDQIVKLLGAEAKNQDHKLILLKLLKEVVFDKSSKGSNDPEDVTVVSSERRSELLAFARQELEKKNKIKN